MRQARHQERQRAENVSAPSTCYRPCNKKAEEVTISEVCWRYMMLQRCSESVAIMSATIDAPNHSQDFLDMRRHLCHTAQTNPRPRKRFIHGILNLKSRWNQVHGSEPGLHGAPKATETYGSYSCKARGFAETMVCRIPLILPFYAIYYTLLYSTLLYSTILYYTCGLSGPRLQTGESELASGSRRPRRTPAASAPASEFYVKGSQSS